MSACGVGAAMRLQTVVLLVSPGSVADTGIPRYCRACGRGAGRRCCDGLLDLCASLSALDCGCQRERSRSGILRALGADLG